MKKQQDKLYYENERLQFELKAELETKSELLEQLLYVTRVLEAALPDSTETLRTECLKLIAKARGESK